MEIVISSPSVADALENESIEMFEMRGTEFKLPERAAGLIHGDRFDSTKNLKSEGFL